MKIDVTDLEIGNVSIHSPRDMKRMTRGKEIFHSEQVNIKTVDKNDKNVKIDANVVGKTSEYNVQIELKGNEVIKWNCTCLDSEDGKVCKHIYATIYETINPHRPNTQKGKEKLEEATRLRKQQEEEAARLRKQQEEEAYKRYIKQREYRMKYYETESLISKYKDLYSNSKEQNIKLQGSADLKKIYKNIQELKNSGNTALYKTYNNVEIIPTINEIEEEQLGIEFKIGEKKKYILKNILDLYQAFKNGSNIEFGKELNLVAKRENISDNSKDILDFILEYGKNMNRNNIIDSYNRYWGANRTIYAVDNEIDNFINLTEKSGIIVDTRMVNKTKFLLTSEEPEIKIKIEKSYNEILEQNEYIFNLNIVTYEYTTSSKCVYIFYNEKIYKCEKSKYPNLDKLLKLFENGNIYVPEDKYEDFYKYVLNYYNKFVKTQQLLEIGNNINGLVVDTLATKMLLDLDDNNNIIMELKFCYKDKEFNILDPDFNEYVNQQNIVRDIPKEKEILEKIFMDGFELGRSKRYFTLKNDEDMYNFLLNKVNDYMEKFEILITDKLKNKKIKNVNVSNVSVKLDGGLLQLDMSKINIDLNEIKGILQNYNIKKKYYKLKNGDFLNLEESDELEFVNEITNNLNTKFENGIAQIPSNRGLYLEKILERNTKIKINKNKEYKELIDNVANKDFSDNIKVDENFENILRDYQKVGYKWIKVLEHYKFGGILADDMGLGKTLQVISVLASNKNNDIPSIVVCPSSLVLNWKKEIEKWSNNRLQTLIISGDALARKNLINTYLDYDVLITSYDLLKRDIDEYEGKNFKYIIADEAQYIKNFSTQNSTALKTLNGEIKLALTGTPIENSISELWSIFDFIMPGYLYSYTKFKKIFEQPILKDNNEDAMKKFKTMISPFILRRIKSDVLTELPEENITVMTNEMTKEQEKIYMSYFVQTKKEVMQQLNEKGFEKSKFKILMLLTRLRQICCHPSLFIENYNDESGKLNQCMDLINEAISSNHKILLFSGYTSMFKIIEEKLKEKNIEYFKLTGSTPVDKRIEMVDDFNKNDNVKIFLISLKAGGTGLNLTSADVVIHYDPWWNVSAENQATDRAYRIGQKNSVQVYKLITNNSIEEKINKLQERKAQISEKILSTEETFINKLSKEEIMNLFD